MFVDLLLYIHIHIPYHIVCTMYDHNKDFSVYLYTHIYIYIYIRIQTRAYEAPSGPPCLSSGDPEACEEAKEKFGLSLSSPFAETKTEA